MDIADLYTRREYGDHVIFLLPCVVVNRPDLSKSWKKLQSGTSMLASKEIMTKPHEQAAETTCKSAIPTSSRRRGSDSRANLTEG